MSFECRSDITSAAAMATAARSFFESHDADGDGRIGVDELTGVLSDLGLKQRGETDVDFKALVVSAMREHDTSLDRTLSFGEFASMYSCITGVALPDDRLEVPAAGPTMGVGDHLPKKSFTKGVPSRDPNTGGITTSPDMDFSFDPGKYLYFPSPHSASTFAHTRLTLSVIGIRARARQRRVRRGEESDAQKNQG
jgi:hypothetical protein